MIRDIRVEKRALRQKYKQIRREMTVEEKALMDKKICDRFTSLWSYRNSETILIYVSSAIEVDTREIINRALKKGKKVAVPRCIDGTSLMEFFFIESLEELSVRSMGILEPERDESKLLTDFSSGICVVPALTFSKDGLRLGYGKGYYDRFLSSFSGSVVGLCYSNCISENLPGGRYDKRVSSIVTDKGIIIV